MNQCFGFTGVCSTMKRHIASVATVTMFWPAASPVVKRQIRNTVSLSMNGSMVISLP